MSYQIDWQEKEGWKYCTEKQQTAQYRFVWNVYMGREELVTTLNNMYAVQSTIHISIIVIVLGCSQ